MAVAAAEVRRPDPPAQVRHASDLWSRRAGPLLPSPLKGGFPPLHCRRRCSVRCQSDCRGVSVVKFGWATALAGTAATSQIASPNRRGRTLMVQRNDVVASPSGCRRVEKRMGEQQPVSGSVDGEEH
ncbi:hypothetical protein U9M48_001015 [Paspalum notatum var. saurae]|uniref:Uncharacterized protein n=1 Tax=Paspalum notatum var. saurae TaxID=547442 RepID=A0AAQ3PL77_PASNO